MLKYNKLNCMKKLDYFNTKQGKGYLCLIRKLSCLHFFIDQEPKGKNGITNEEKISFQKQIFAQMKSHHRNAYRTPVLLRMSFSSSIHTAPSLHKIVKNYLDLLSDVVSDAEIGRKKLLYRDDKQVKALFATQSFCLGDRPSIYIKAEKFSDFIRDLEIAKEFDLFEEIDEDYFYDKRCLEVLRDLQENKKEIINNKGEEYYLNREQYLIKIVQEYYLEREKLNSFDIISLFSSLFGGKESLFSEYIDKMYLSNRDKLLNTSFFIKKVTPPNSQNSTSLFRINIQEVLEDFKRKNPLMFPLRHPLAVMILYVPPKGQIIDLDNLALSIIPKITEILKPPSSYLNLINNQSGNKEQQLIIEELKKKIPKSCENAIVSYQIFEIPRREQDPENGLVRVIFYNDMYSNNIFNSLENVIRDWMEKD